MVVVSWFFLFLLILFNFIFKGRREARGVAVPQTLGEAAAGPRPGSASRCRSLQRAPAGPGPSAAARGVEREPGRTRPFAAACPARPRCPSSPCRAPLSRAIIWF